MALGGQPSIGPERQLSAAELSGRNHSRLVLAGSSKAANGAATVGSRLNNARMVYSPAEFPNVVKILFEHIACAWN